MNGENGFLHFVPVNATVRLTSTGNSVSEYQDFPFAPTETMLGRTKKQEVSLGAWYGDQYWLRYD